VEIGYDPHREATAKCCVVTFSIEANGLI